MNTFTLHIHILYHYREDNACLPEGIISPSLMTVAMMTFASMGFLCWGITPLTF